MRRILGILYCNVSINVTLVFGTFSVQNWSSDKDVQTIVCEYPKLKLPNSDHAVICEYISEPCSAAVRLNSGQAPIQKNVNCSCWHQVFPGLHRSYQSILGEYAFYLALAFRKM